MLPRLRTGAAAAVAVALLLSACGGSDEASTTPEASGGAAFPVTVTHELGSATIEKAPERIVVLSDADLDSLLSLGLQPVGVSESIGDDGLTPWASPKVTSKPEVLSAGDNGFDIEQILALEPDLVLAGGDYYIDSEYEKLQASGIPVVAYEEGPAEDSWQANVRQVGKAVGKGAEAEKVVETAEAQIAQVRADNPAIAGKTFALTQMWEAGSIGVLRSAEDSGVKMLNDFGLELDPKSAALQSEDFAAQLSLEKVATLDADILLTYFADPGLQPALEGNALFENLDVVERGSFAPLTVEQFSALRGPTPISIPYTVENVVPLITKAASAA